MHRLRRAPASALVLLGVLGLAAPSRGEEPVSFKDKSVQMIIGYAAGGGTDLVGRLVATYLGRHLEGRPAVIVRNMPGADGVVSLNYVVQQTRPDGLTLIMGSNTGLDPMSYRRPIAHFDPAKFGYVGGVGRGGTALLVSLGAEPRLRDPTAAPVVMGIDTVPPNKGMQLALWGAEHFGWNMKWVTGYAGNNSTILALERGEIDMTATGNLYQVKELVGSTRFRILVQSGHRAEGRFLPRPEFADAPVLNDLVSGRFKDALSEQAFQYWSSMNALDKYVALAPGTPEPTVAAYRAAFARLAADPGFTAEGKRLSDDFTPVAAADMELLVKNLAAVPDAAIAYTKTVMRKQGLPTD